MAAFDINSLRQAVRMDRKDLLTVYGSPGCGKTSLAAEFPSPQFIVDGQDEGYADLVRSGLIEKKFEPLVVKDWDSLVQVTAHLADPATPLEAETYVFENLGGFQLYLIEAAIDRDVKASGKSPDSVRAAFYAWGGQGFKAEVSAWSSWFRNVNRLREKNNTAGKPIRVILLGHTTLVKDKNIAGELGEEFHRVDMSLHPTLSEIVHRDCGNIGWARQRAVVVKSDKGGVGKAIGDDIRELVFHPSVHATAKNRWGLGPDPIPMGTSAKHAYANLVNAIGAAKKARQTQGEK